MGLTLKGDESGRLELHASALDPRHTYSVSGEDSGSTFRVDLVILDGK